MGRLILMRHGQSVWNAERRFSGWIDVPLSRLGVDEALAAGLLLHGKEIHRLYTSDLVRSSSSATLALVDHEQTPIPVEHGCSGQRTIPWVRSFALRERHYGLLQGKKKDNAILEHGEEQVRVWRRGYDTPPPGGESLAMTSQRVVPYFNQEIEPHLERGETVFICAHGNSLRALCMELDALSPEQVQNLEIPTGIPLFYLYEGGQWTQEK